MAKISVYLNFNNEAEEAFTFYKKVFRTDFEGEILRFRDMPTNEQAPPLTDEEKNLVMNVGLPIGQGSMLRGSDLPKSMGGPITQGNNMYIHLEIDTKQEVDRLYSELQAEGRVEMQLEKQFWGDYFGAVVDKFGIKWMISCPI